MIYEKSAYPVEVKVSVTESFETWVRVEDPFCDAALGYKYGYRKLG